MILEKLRELDLELPSYSKPGGAYESVNIRGNQAFVAIQFPIRDGQFQYRGILGKDLNTANGVKAMELCALNVLSQIHHKIGFDKVEGINHLDIYYTASEDWDDAPIVADGASSLFVKVLADRGKHSRAIMGVQSLARNFSVGLVCNLTLTPAR